MTPPPDAACVREVRPYGDSTLVVLCGEIDLCTAIGVAESLDALTHTGTADLLIDLRSVGFIDCAGVRLLDRIRARTSDRRGRLRLICVPGTTLDLLQHPCLELDFVILDRLPAVTPAPASVATPATTPATASAPPPDDRTIVA
ncbi:STAS domain-containing protein [Streptomyces sp. 549]|uniref:STAS domain-containing protein n=1 Tax=Streptomyces sp. 549 TaxID=3049076 RepID=UPI0024C40BCE|nr:STAS domain-containing protein [Streptomyces sp. 549]MDK1475518.1 STAS domain-containing protein [Streptomyces sp. 549]